MRETEISHSVGNNYDAAISLGLSVEKAKKVREEEKGLSLRTVSLFSLSPADDVALRVDFALRRTHLFYQPPTRKCLRVREGRRATEQSEHRRTLSACEKASNGVINDERRKKEKTSQGRMFMFAHRERERKLLCKKDTPNV